MGHFTELERQYCLFSTAGYKGAKSPDHADAAIWGLHELLIDQEPEPNIRFPDIYSTDVSPDGDEGDGPDEDVVETVAEAMARRFGGRLGSY